MQLLEDSIDKMFRWGLVWSVGCTTNLDGRLKFNNFLRELDIRKSMKVFPDEGTIYDYEFKQKEHIWTEWIDSFKNF